MMFIGISIIICSLLYSLLVTIIYFLKPHLLSIEIELYKKILIINLFNLLLELGCFITIGHAKIIPITAAIVSRLFLLSLLLWNLLFASYIFYISLNHTSKEEKICSLLLKLETIFFSVGTIVVATVPLHYYYKENTMYSYGISANYVTTIYVFNLLLSLFIAIKKNKYIAIKKLIPLFILVILVGMCIVIRLFEPGLNIISSIMALVTVLMYFTIENPDVKLINELELAKSNAEKANLAKTEFLSSMSHEIRTPLNAIVGFSNAILESKVTEVQEEAKDIVMASENLLEIVNGILDISKIEAGKMEVVETDYNFKDMCENILKLITPRIAEKEIELKSNYQKDLPVILHGDIGKMKEIITNLLTNAAKYTDKGLIELSVSCINTKNISKLVISVEDTGRGISPDKIDKLFNKFQRLEEDKNTTLEGTGLGLAITKSLVEMMNGTIVVQSKYGIGSKFTVTITQKIVSMEEDKKIKQEENTEKIDFSKKKILVVDDNNLNLKVALRLLETYSIVPDMCTSGYECLEKIKEKSYDLILLDDMMPKMSGTETLKQIKKEYPNLKTKIICLTANAISGMKEKYIQDGFDDYLAKPIDKLELKRVLKSYLKK